MGEASEEGVKSSHYDNRLAIRLSVLAVAVTIAGLVAAFVRPDWAKTVGIVLTVGWVLGPPAWLMFDWWLFVAEKPGDFEQFKHSQDLARNLWLAFAAVVAYASGIRLAG